MSRGWMMLAILPGLLGCTPDGPTQFYRSALQARSEFADSLSKIVDDASAKETYPRSSQLYQARMKEIVDAIKSAQFPRAFQKLSNESFNPNKIEANDLALMLDGIRSYANYCNNVVYTDVRIVRERARIAKAMQLQVAALAKKQIENNEQVTADYGTACPFMSNAFSNFDTIINQDVRYIPTTVTEQHLNRLKHGLSEDDIKLIVSFDPKALSEKFRDFTAPPLAEWPQWAIDVDRRLNGSILGRPLPAQVKK